MLDLQNGAMLARVAYIALRMLIGYSCIHVLLVNSEKKMKFYVNNSNTPLCLKKKPYFLYTLLLQGCYQAPGECDKKFVHFEAISTLRSWDKKEKTR